MHLKICLFLSLILNYSAVLSVNPYCGMSCDNITHACCKFEKANPGPRCKSPYSFHPMSDNDRMLVLMMHNAIRNSIASGTDPHLPFPSANMQLLLYDRELEFLASCWATQCKKKSYGCLNSRRGPTAHHVWQDRERKAGKSTGKKFLTYSLYNIYNQLDRIDENTVKSFKIANLTQQLLLVSQVLWADTKYVGCSRVTFGSNDWKYNMVNVVCAYYPRGNLVSQPMYIIGKPCSGCVYGSYCHVNYTSLCTPFSTRSLDNFTKPFQISRSYACGPEISFAILFLVLFFVIHGTYVE